MRNAQEFYEDQVDLFNAWHVCVLENLQKHSCFRIIRSSKMWESQTSPSAPFMMSAEVIPEHLMEGCTERRHQCYWCSYSSPKSDNVSRHLKRSFRIATEPSKDQQGPSSPLLVDQNNNNNNDDGCPDESSKVNTIRLEAFSCVSCHQDFPSECLLGQHNKTVHKNREKSFVCHEGDCEFRCNSRSEYNRHVYHHTNLVSFRCDVCGNFPLQATRMDNITRHVRNHLKPFERDSPEYCRIVELNEEVLAQARIWVPRVKRCFWYTHNFQKENLTEEDLKKLSYRDGKIVILMKADSITEDDRQMLVQVNTRKKKSSVSDRKPRKKKDNANSLLLGAMDALDEELPQEPPLNGAVAATYIQLQSPLEGLGSQEASDIYCIDSSKNFLMMVEASSEVAAQGLSKQGQDQQAKDILEDPLECGDELRMIASDLDELDGRGGLQEEAIFPNGQSHQPVQRQQPQQRQVCILDPPSAGSSWLGTQTQQCWSYGSQSAVVEEFSRPPDNAAAPTNTIAAQTNGLCVDVERNYLFQGALGVGDEDFDICRYIDAEACALGIFSNVTLDEDVVANPSSILPESEVDRGVVQIKAETPRGLEMEPKLGAMIESWPEQLGSPWAAGSQFSDTLSNSSREVTGDRRKIFAASVLKAGDPL